MAFHRRQRGYRLGETIVSCSVCGGSFMWPSEIERAVDGTWRCFRACAEQTQQEYDEIISRTHASRRDEIEKIPEGVSYPPWYTE